MNGFLVQEVTVQSHEIQAKDTEVGYLNNVTVICPFLLAQQ